MQSDHGTHHCKDYAAHLAALGESSEWLDAAAMRAVTGTDYYDSGLYTPGTAMIQPALFVRDVAAGLKSNRVSIYENSPVTALTRNGVWVAETPMRCTEKKIGQKMYTVFVPELFEHENSHFM
ncbi:MAG: FAD-dependent oxidoreductase [Chloroflexota bacterium]